jgi:predicted GNAT family N-acyltransferase
MGGRAPNARRQPNRVLARRLRRRLCAGGGEAAVPSCVRVSLCTDDRRQEQIGVLLLAKAENWARDEGLVLNARLGAEGFYARFGYHAEGEPFEENNIPHIKMTKRLGLTEAG